MSVRLEKINELIRQQLGDLFSRELVPAPGVFMTITKVDTTPDLRYARVFISVFPETDRPSVARMLQRRQYRLQGMLNRKLSLKPLPRLEFHFDNTEVRADAVEKILSQLQKSKD